MRLHGRGIDEHLGGGTASLGQGLEQIGPDALGRPAHEPVVERLPRAIDLAWRIRPTPARLQYIDDAADHPTVIDALLAPRICRQMRLNLRKLCVRQPKLAHPVLLPDKGITDLPAKPNLWVRSLA